MALTLVPTPIGNLEDITLRAIRVLKEADLLLAEDTRQTLKLLRHLEVEKKVRSFHQHNEHREVENILRLLEAGQQVALVSDAGTPGISDPGYLLVRECIKKGISVECLPGATALIPALVQSGIPSDRFCFEGFLPHKKGRRSRLLALVEETRTLVFYESPHRLLKTLKEMGEHFGEERQAAVSRELTKIYAETVRGSLAELVQHFEEKGVKGEIVIVLAGKTPEKKSQYSHSEED